MLNMINRMAAWKKVAKKYRDLYLYGRMVRRHADANHDRYRKEAHEDRQRLGRENKSLRVKVASLEKRVDHYEQLERSIIPDLRAARHLDSKLVGPYVLYFCAKCHEGVVIHDVTGTACRHCGQGHRFPYEVEAELKRAVALTHGNKDQRTLSQEI